MCAHLKISHAQNVSVSQLAWVLISNVFCIVSLSKADQIFNAVFLIYNYIYFRIHKVQNVQKIPHL